MKLAGLLLGLVLAEEKNSCNSVPAPCDKFETCTDSAAGAVCSFDKKLCPTPIGDDDSYNTGVGDNGKKNFPISWKGSKTVWKYSMRSQDCYIYRHSFPDNAKDITGKDVRKIGYNGFLYYGRKFCGGDFLTKVMDNSIKIDMIDYAANLYEFHHRYYRDSGSKTALAIQFRQTLPGGRQRRSKKSNPIIEMSKNGKSSKTDLGNKKMDQVYIRYCAAPEDFIFKGTPEDCLNKVNLGVLKYEWADGDNGEVINWAQCAAWSYNIS